MLTRDWECFQRIGILNEEGQRGRTRQSAETEGIVLFAASWTEHPTPPPGARRGGAMRRITAGRLAAVEHPLFTLTRQGPQTGATDGSSESPLEAEVVIEPTMRLLPAEM
ncbi:hypothetical protein GCM10010185_42310 [Saccharothrix coeruleofusca]|uniref:Uncharacterized protein n=1 Tax=Saccharothrix coeruleofusca TaxID=33919 RepID=A0A918ANY8_9PSEU|nr:hypothetical protein GCM10010185_42310 [Saccharothrix coeruleofusca]